MTCPANAWTANAPNPNLLEGALVQGPQKPNDGYTDRRQSADAYVSLAQNAGFTGARWRAWYLCWFQQVPVRAATVEQVGMWWYA